jgi:long-chain acyl-CoA synthetase
MLLLLLLLCPQVRAALGVRQTIISGGGSLAGHLDLFFEALGVTLLNGWGLTETSPVLSCRR